MEETIKTVLEFQKFCGKRAYELIMAGGCSTRLNITPDKVKPSEDGTQILVKFIESTSHDCPETEYITLFLSDLLLTDDDWETYILSIRKKHDDALIEQMVQYMKSEIDVRIANNLKKIEELQRENELLNKN